MGTCSCIVFAVAAFGAFFALWLTEEESPPKLNLKDVADSQYDYIIVGGGSAGCVVATRLSEDPHAKVLLLEAGDDGTDISLRVPILATSNLNGTRDWNYATTKQDKACLGLSGQTCAWARGKTLGGSGSINGMVYVRGSRHDYDEWAARGAEGWSFEDVLPYFIKSENMAEKKLRNSRFHGTSGPMNVTILKQSPIAEFINQAGEELGLPVGEDYNDMTHLEGVHPIQLHTINGLRRSSTAQTHLWPVMDRKNLHVVVHAHVTKVHFEGPTAVGVQYTGKDGKIRLVMAKKEVILSAGTVASAQLLLLSGVGPKKHLDEMGIPVVADLPVGENVQEHMTMFVPQITIDKPISITPDDVMSLGSRLRYKLWKTGPMANTYLGDNLIWLHSQYAKETGLKTPDIQISVLAFLDKGQFRAAFDYTDEINDGYFMKSGKYGFSPVLSIGRPESRGVIRLRSKNPFDQPIIDARYLHKEGDLVRFIEGIRFLEKLVSTKALQKIGAKILDYSYPFPGCQQHKVGTDAYWTCVAYQAVWNFSHATGSCRMGARDDPEAVVDPQLRVRGIDKLRVVDGSVMASQVAGNTNAVAVMIAEKGSDMIKGA